MPLTGVIPEQILTIAAAATVFTVMFDVGLVIEIGEFRWVSRHPALVAKALFAVLIAVPAVAVAVVHAFDLSRAAEIAIVLMAISPGAPVALRRSLDAGGHRSFAPALQIMVAILAVLSMPLWIAALNEFYGGNASISPRELARQVFVAQLLPLGLGMLARRAVPTAAAWLQPRLARFANLLLVALTILVLIDVFGAVVDAGWRIALAIVIITTLALAMGHRLGGVDSTTRSAVAISSAARNPGLALLVAALNHAPPEINATILAYLVVSALTVLVYVIWRRHAATRSSIGVR
jgi:bile acid:Na+ symporter, BASS family